MIYVQLVSTFFLLSLGGISATNVTVGVESANMDDLVVTTTTGLVRGAVGGYTESKNRTIYWFRGIPFAEPPVGSLRFEPPVPKKKWEGILDASENGPECIQSSDPVKGSEDCLYLKIYTTKLPRQQKQKLPVMVWYHGGAFAWGNSSFDKYTPDFLLDEDVIIVAPHYRLGIFGFLSTGDLVVPGNNGLKDQVLALKWIKENIEAFGGDANNITIFGQSAGGASVSYLVQTNQTKGLFNRAIMQSGVSLCLWAYFRSGLEFAKIVAEKLEVDTNSSQSLVDGLKSIDAKVLQETQLSSLKNMLLTSNPRDGKIPGPVIEPEHEEAIFSEISYEALKKGQFNHVPLMVGHTSLEAYLSEISDHLRKWLARYDLDTSKLVPIGMQIGKEFDDDELGRIIKKEYFGENLIALSNQELMEYVSDDQFERPIQESIRLYSAYVPVFYYKYSYEHSLKNRTVRGVGHSEDLESIFNYKQKDNKEDTLIRERMVKLFTNFAKTGNPTPKSDLLLQNITWPPNSGESDDLQCLNVDHDLKIIKNPDSKRMTFWKELFHKYGVPPFDTY